MAERSGNKYPGSDASSGSELNFSNPLISDKKQNTPPENHKMVGRSKSKTRILFKAVVVVSLLISGVILLFVSSLNSREERVQLETPSEILRPIHTEVLVSDELQKTASSLDIYLNSSNAMIIPKPLEYEFSKGVFLLLNGLEVEIKSLKPDSLEGSYSALSDHVSKLTEKEVSLKISDKSASITLNQGPNSVNGFDVRGGGYVLEISPSQVRLSSETAQGIFYGVQTIRQLIRSVKVDGKRVWHLPCVVIRDRPLYPWRGMHLDVARHFFGVKTVKRFIDIISLYKFNVLHWHLVDDQGWRFEIKKYPKLVSVGSKRKGTQTSKNNREPDNGVPYEGHYTQEQVKEIVAYAAERFITILPEIEIPGHCQAVVAAYPELGNTDIPGWKAPDVRTKWGVSDFTLNLESSTIDFFKNVLDEVIDLFPSEYIHIGGDEAPTTQWSQSPRALDKMRAANLTGANHLQGHLTEIFRKYLGSKGRRAIGWSEVMNMACHVDKSVAAMVWIDQSLLVKGPKEGRFVVNADVGYTYFDGDVSIEKVYKFQPAPSTLSKEERKFVLGAQAQLWSEWIVTQDDLDVRAFPRTLAVAEAVWSTGERTDFSDFSQRLKLELSRLDKRGVKYKK
eukprot:845241_1